MTEQCGHDVDLVKDHVSCLSITDGHAPPRSGTKTFKPPARDSISRDRLRIRATRQILLDNSDEIETAWRLWDNAMAIDATTIARFFRRDQHRHENDRYTVQGPVGFELRRYFRAVRLRH